MNEVIRNTLQLKVHDHFANAMSFIVTELLLHTNVHSWTFRDIIIVKVYIPEVLLLRPFYQLR